MEVCVHFSETVNTNKKRTSKIVYKTLNMISYNSVFVVILVLIVAVSIPIYTKLEKTVNSNFSRNL